MVGNLVISKRNSFTTNLRSSIGLVTKRRPHVRCISFLRSRSASSLRMGVGTTLTGLGYYGKMLILYSLIKNSPFGATISLAGSGRSATIVNKTGLTVIVRATVVGSGISVSRLGRVTVASKGRTVGYFRGSSHLGESKTNVW